VGKDKDGNFQHCHAILDDKPYFAVYGKEVNLEDLTGPDKKAVEEGSHILTIFPARNFHVSVKSEGACAQVRFHVKKKEGELPGPKDPQLIYSRPKGEYDSSKGEAHAILLDFYVLNCSLGEGHQVKVTVSTGEELTVTEWWPQLILKGAKPGKYSVTIELQNKAGTRVPGRFTKTTREVTVK
jgi:hypothetical protein